jgi:hypothetical protein
MRGYFSGSIIFFPLPSPLPEGEGAMGNTGSRGLMSRRVKNAFLLPQGEGQDEGILLDLLFIPSPQPSPGGRGGNG